LHFRLLSGKIQVQGKNDSCNEVLRARADTYHSGLLVGVSNRQRFEAPFLFIRYAKDGQKEVIFMILLANGKVITRDPEGIGYLPDGGVVTGKTSPLLGASASLLLNALKHMAGIDHRLDLIPPSVIEPISAMKTDCLGHRNPRLHSDEVLIALAISALTNPLAAMVQAQLKSLRGCDAHFSVIISEEDAKLYKRLGINVSCEPKYEVKSLYHK